jgi:hypothetical protein
MMTEGFSTENEILDDILKTLSDEEKEKIKKLSPTKFLVKEHFNLGLLIRNKYFYQNKKQEELIKNIGNEDIFLFLDGNDFSDIILEKLYDRITTENKQQP